MRTNANYDLKRNENSHFLTSEFQSRCKKISKIAIHLHYEPINMRTATDFGDFQIQVYSWILKPKE